jgi:hypothetical protein
MRTPHSDRQSASHVAVSRPYSSKVRRWCNRFDCLAIHIALTIADFHQDVTELAVPDVAKHSVGLEWQRRLLAVDMPDMRFWEKVVRHLDELYIFTV